MKNTAQDLNNYLFEEIERLQGDLSNEELDREIKRAETVGKIAKTIIDNGNMVLSARKHFDEYGLEGTIAVPLLGMTDKGLAEENKNLRKQVDKMQKW